SWRAPARISPTRHGRLRRRRDRAAAGGSLSVAGELVANAPAGLVPPGRCRYADWRHRQHGPVAALPSRRAERHTGRRRDALLSQRTERAARRTGTGRRAARPTSRREIDRRRGSTAAGVPARAAVRAPPRKAARARLMPVTHIHVKGAREHNLKNIDIQIPRDKMVVITGLSGSGKSSLAFDTIYAEGQRRYVESLSAYARQFLGQMEKPDVDFIEG